MIGEDDVPWPRVIELCEDQLRTEWHHRNAGVLPVPGRCAERCLNN